MRIEHALVTPFTPRYITVSHYRERNLIKLHSFHFSRYRDKYDVGAWHVKEKDQ